MMSGTGILLCVRNADESHLCANPQCGLFCWKFYVFYYSIHDYHLMKGIRRRVSADQYYCV